MKGWISSDSYLDAVFVLSESLYSHRRSHYKCRPMSEGSMFASSLTQASSLDTWDLRLLHIRELHYESKSLAPLYQRSCSFVEKHFLRSINFSQSTKSFQSCFAPFPRFTCSTSGWDSSVSFQPSQVSSAKGYHVKKHENRAVKPK